MKPARIAFVLACCCGAFSTLTVRAADEAPIGPLLEEPQSEEPQSIAGETLVTSSVKATRQGGFLKLDYIRSDPSGQAGTLDRTGDPPRFVVYQGNEEIGSGRFEYG